MYSIAQRLERILERQFAQERALARLHEARVEKSKADAHAKVEELKP